MSDRNSAAEQPWLLNSRLRRAPRAAQVPWSIAHKSRFGVCLASFGTYFSCFHPPSANGETDGMSKKQVNPRAVPRTSIVCLSLAQEGPLTCSAKYLKCYPTTWHDCVSPILGMYLTYPSGQGTHRKWFAKARKYLEGA